MAVSNDYQMRLYQTGKRHSLDAREALHKNCPKLNLSGGVHRFPSISCCGKIFCKVKYGTPRSFKTTSDRNSWQWRAKNRAEVFLSSPQNLKSRKWNLKIVFLRSEFVPCAFLHWKIQRCNRLTRDCAINQRRLFSTVNGTTTCCTFAYGEWKSVNPNSTFWPQPRCEHTTPIKNGFFCSDACHRNGTGIESDWDSRMHPCKESLTIISRNSLEHMSCTFTLGFPREWNTMRNTRLQQKNSLPLPLFRSITFSACCKHGMFFMSSLLMSVLQPPPRSFSSIQSSPLLKIIIRNDFLFHFHDREKRRDILLVSWG